MKNKLLLWTLFLFLLLISSYYSFELGVIEELYEADKSRLSWLILSVFLISYLRLGSLIRSKRITKETLDPGFESAEYCMGLGLLGTVIGFIIMLGSMFSGLDLTDPESVNLLFESVTNGMSTALYTTAVGVSTSLLLRASHYLTWRFK